MCGKVELDGCRVIPVASSGVRYRVGDRIVTRRWVGIVIFQSGELIVLKDEKTDDALGAFTASQVEKLLREDLRRPSFMETFFERLFNL